MARALYTHFAALIIIAIMLLVPPSANLIVLNLSTIQVLNHDSNSSSNSIIVTVVDEIHTACCSHAETKRCCTGVHSRLGLDKICLA